MKRYKNDELNKTDWIFKMPPIPEPNTSNSYHCNHVQLLCDSYHHFTGHHLIDPVASGIEKARRLFQAPFVVLSHNTDEDPIFTYANQTALALFEFSWDEITQLPSRKSAESPNRQERARLLATVAENGYIDNYTGIRISKSGKRFLVNQAIVWNLVDKRNNFRGQAATFSQWQML